MCRRIIGTMAGEQNQIVNNSNKIIKAAIATVLVVTKSRLHTTHHHHSGSHQTVTTREKAFSNSPKPFDIGLIKMAFVPSVFSASLPSSFRSYTPKCSSCSIARYSRRAFLTASTAFALIPIKMSAAASGIQTEELATGNGQGFKSKDQINLHYTLTLNGFEDQGGKVVDSSRSRGRPFRYDLLSFFLWLLMPFLPTYEAPL